jgi:hypothetical protein
MGPILTRHVLLKCSNDGWPLRPSLTSKTLATCEACQVQCSEHAREDFPARTLPSDKVYCTGIWQEKARTISHFGPIVYPRTNPVNSPPRCPVHAKTTFSDVSQTVTVLSSKEHMRQRKCARRTAVVDHGSGCGSQPDIERNNSSNVQQLLAGALNSPVAEKVSCCRSCTSSASLRCAAGCNSIAGWHEGKSHATAGA